MNRSTTETCTFTAAAAVALLFLPAIASADSGFFIGGSAGGATIEADIGTDPDLPELPSSIDEDDTAYKLFAGYTFDLPVIDLGVEGGYVNFGKPEIDIGIDSAQIEIETTGFNLWGVAGIDVGPVDLFAKLGYVFWDVEVSAPAFPELGSESDDGTDIGYGLGAAFNLGRISIRGEYEVYDLDDADLSMLSVGLAFRF
jgi:outer membrane immunogenic protein